jgi:hypothetical protein
MAGPAMWGPRRLQRPIRTRSMLSLLVNGLRSTVSCTYVIDRSSTKGGVTIFFFFKFWFDSVQYLSYLLPLPNSTLYLVERVVYTDFREGKNEKIIE